MRRRPHPGFWDHSQRLSGADPGGGGGRGLGRSIDFYSGFRKKSRYTLLYFREEKKHKEGVPFEILRNPGIDFS